MEVIKALEVRAFCIFSSLPNQPEQLKSESHIPFDSYNVETLKKFFETRNNKIFS